MEVMLNFKLHEQLQPMLPQPQQPRQPLLRSLLVPPLQWLQPMKSGFEERVRHR